VTPELVEQARQQLQDLLSFFEVNAEVEASSNEDTITLEVPGEGDGRLIGHRGEVLAALQHMMNMMVRRQTQERVYVHVDIGGYRRARLDKLEAEARQARDKVQAEGGEVVLPMMSSAERRHIHSYVGELGEVKSESRGEGNRRRLVITATE
jgi:spoIIIJ-associated protein